MPSLQKSIHRWIHGSVVAIVVCMFLFPAPCFSQAPAISSFSPTTVCQGRNVTISGSDFTNVTRVAINGQTVAFSVSNAGEIIATVGVNDASGVIRVETAQGNVTSATALTVIPSPRPDLDDQSGQGFSNCNSVASYTLNVSNSSQVSGSGNQYTIDWGDGSGNFTATDWPNGALQSHTYNAQGYFNITVTITPANGCTVTRNIQFYNGSNPLASFTTTSSTTGLCAPAPVQFRIGNWFTNSPGTRYEIDFGDGTPRVVLPHPLNATNTDYLLSHTYSTSSCPATDFTATLRAINGCFTTTYTLNQILIRRKPAANFTFTPTQPCITGQVCFNNTTVAGYTGNNCNTATTYTWDLGDGTTYNGITPPCHTYATAATYNVTLTAGNTGCGTDVITRQIVVQPQSPPPAVTPVAYCLNATAAQLTATGTALRWYTSATGGAGSPTAPTPSTNTPGVVNYYVTQTLPGQCESVRTPLPVTTHPATPAPGVTSPVMLCLNQAATPLTATGSGLLWYTTATGGTGDATAPTPSTAATGNTDYYVSQTVNGCEGPRALIRVTVSPLPVAPVVVTPINYCQFATAIPLTAPGTGLLWYTAAIGGSGSPTAPVPPTGTPGTTTWYVSQATGCGESPRSPIEVIVTAAPNANISYAPNLLCNIATTPVVPVTLSGTTGGTFSISPGGMTIATDGTIAPAGATAGVYTINYRIPAAGGCALYNTSATVTVNGTPTATISYPDLCTSGNPTPVIRTGSAGGTYSAPAGLTIDAVSGVITPGSSTPGTYIVTYTIAAAPPCPGFSTTATLTITAAPTATISYPLSVLCNASDIPAHPNPPVVVTQTGTTGGQYTVQPATGLQVDATTGLITPAGATPGVYTISYTAPGSAPCANYVTSFNVTVNGAPVAAISYPAICSNDGVTSVSRTGSSGGVYSSTPGLTINSATGAITPGSSTPGTYTVTYDIAAAGPCPGFNTTASVTITPAPTATISYTPSILCNVANAPVAVVLTGTPGGTFTVTPVGLSVNPGTGEITPAGATPGTYTIRYTAPGTGPCANYVASANVTVNGAPTATISYPAICSNDAITPVTLSGSSGGVYSATTGLTINPSTGAITPGSSTPGTYTVNYDIAAAGPCPGFNTSTSVTITAAPTATISYTPAILCNVANTATTPNAPVPVVLTGTTGGTFAVTPAGLPINTTTGDIAPAGATPGVYTIRYTAPGTGGCANYVASTTVTVTAAPTATINYPGSPYCGAINTPQAVTLTGSAGGVFSAAPGLSINATTGAINPAASTPGIYTVTYNIAASTPCPSFTTAATVQIVESPVISFAQPNQAICSGGSATYVAASTVPGTTYTWSLTAPLPPGVNGSISAPGGTSSATLSFTNTTVTNQTVSVRVTPVNPTPISCAGAPVTITLLVRPVVPAPVTSTANFCMDVPPQTLQVTPLPGMTIRWFDQNQQPLAAAPVVNTAISGTYTYYVSHVTADNCESIRSRISAIVHPTLKIIGSAYQNPTTCGVPSGSITLNVTDLSNNFVPQLPVTVHYQKFGLPYTFSGTTTAAGQIILPLTAGTYSNFAVETSGGCISQVLPDVFILRDPSPPAAPTAGYNPPVCTGNPLRLTALTATSEQAGPIDYVWAGPAFGPYADTVRNTVVNFPTASMSHTGTYVVYAMQNNCISLPASFQLTVIQGPTKPSIVTRSPLCVGEALTLQAFSSIGGNNSLTYEWRGPAAGFPVRAANAVINPVSLRDAGIYTITVTSPQTGCSMSTDTTIRIGDYPVVRFAQDTITVATGVRIPLAPQIMNSSAPGVLPIERYTWTPMKDLECNDAICATPIATAKNNICYNVQVTNVFGCSASDDICIRVFCNNTQVFIPNAFAPNGNVPENRILMVRASGINAIKSFRVFNRWGQLMYERTNFPPNSPQFGWDGMIKGRKADVGVYVYTVEVVCENGVPYSYKGNVTLF
ncbi:PKD domain-containing protein [uncultured Chitinophaga sp.]|uniref:Ig-like domain-containing protein n=1 Tax=uncultured Chitinophaga sp. TaxID=339340 RepID=UPI0025FD284A|nr:PKD domain-containing protein [uncultured Chitinophaga sp.]